MLHKFAQIIQSCLHKKITHTHRYLYVPSVIIEDKNLFWIWVCSKLFQIIWSNQNIEVLHVVKCLRLQSQGGGAHFLVFCGSTHSQRTFLCLLFPHTSLLRTVRRFEKTWDEETRRHERKKLSEGLLLRTVFSVLVRTLLATTLRETTVALRTYYRSSLEQAGNTCCSCSTYCTLCT